MLKAGDIIAIKDTRDGACYLAANMAFIMASLNVQYDYNNPPVYPNGTIAVPQSDLDTLQNGVNQWKQFATALFNGAYNNTTNCYNVLVGMVKLLSRLHKFTSTWYVQGYGSTSNNGSVSGAGFFQENLSQLPVYTFVSGGNCSGWKRDTSSGCLSFDANHTIVSNNIMSATHINNYLDTVIANWREAYNSQVISYEYWTCHSNCHSSCHASRGRR